MPAAVDLWAKRPADLARVIFEVKGLSTGNAVAQCRATLSQLLEYRFFMELTRIGCASWSIARSPTVGERCLRVWELEFSS